VEIGEERLLENIGDENTSNSGDDCPEGGEERANPACSRVAGSKVSRWFMQAPVCPARCRLITPAGR